MGRMMLVAALIAACSARTTPGRPAPDSLERATVHELNRKQRTHLASFRADITPGAVRYYRFLLGANPGYVTVGVSYRGDIDALQLDLLDDAGHSIGHGIADARTVDAPRTGGSEVQARELSRSIYARVTARANTTLDDTKYDIVVAFIPDAPLTTATTPCDPDHIDPANPECEGVFPKCNANQPDFEHNPTCCATWCRGPCQGRLIKVDDDGKGGTISIGASAGIVVSAWGYVIPPNPSMARMHVNVVHVEEHQAIVTIENRDRIPASALADLSVALSAPNQCNHR
jgi:hypothetical protein